MPATKRRASVEVREASFDDYDQIAQLESRYKLESKPPDEWQHLWTNNPVYQGLTNHWPIGWVVEDSNHKVVGYLGNIPLSYEFEGKTLLSATTRAWVVEEPYRGYSILLLDHFFSQNTVDLYLTTTLNSQAFDGFRVFEPSPVPVGDWDRSRFWVTNPLGFTGSMLSFKDVAFSKLLSYPLSIPISFKGRFARKRLGRNGKSIRVEACTRFDERFDTFWEELKQRRWNVLLGTRTRQILDWHFKHALKRQDAWISCVSEGSRLVAYAAFYRHDNPSVGLKRMRLADFQTLTDDKLIVPIISHALECCRRDGVHMLEMIGLSAEKSHVIAELAPHERKLPTWMSFYKTSNPHLNEKLKHGETWDLCCFDGDSSL
jgi:hypothetical protein